MPYLKKITMVMKVFNYFDKTVDSASYIEVTPYPATNGIVTNRRCDVAISSSETNEEAQGKI